MYWKRLLTLLRRAEAWEQLSVEDQALRAGQIYQHTEFAGSFPRLWMRGVHVPVRHPLAGCRR
jgi:hypothetical protein